MGKKEKRKAERDVGPPVSVAACCDCDWSCDTWNAAHGAGAVHAKAFGHMVRVEVSRTICYHGPERAHDVPDMDGWWTPALSRAIWRGYSGRPTAGPDDEPGAPEWPQGASRPLFAGGITFAGEVYDLSSPKAVGELQAAIVHLEQTALGQASGIHRCEECGMPYYRRVPRHRFCSERCRATAKLAELEATQACDECERDTEFQGHGVFKLQPGYAEEV